MCCRPEVDCDVIFGRNEKTIVGYVVANFEVAISYSFRDIKKNHLVTAEAAADIDDNIKRKRIRVSLNSVPQNGGLGRPIPLKWTDINLLPVRPWCRSGQFGVLQRLHALSYFGHTTRFAHFWVT